MIINNLLTLYSGNDFERNSIVTGLSLLYDSGAFDAQTDGQN